MLEIEYKIYYSKDNGIHFEQVTIARISGNDMLEIRKQRLALQAYLNNNDESDPGTYRVGIK